jgi:hypothetical protein
LALISAITLVCLACLSAGAWLVFERPLTHQPFPTTLYSALGSAGPGATAPAPLGQDSRPSAGNRRRLVEGYGRIPLNFEANAGQTDARVKFLSRGSGYTLFLTRDEAVLALKKSESRNQKAEARRSKLEIGNLKLDTATGIPRPLIENLEAPIRASEPRTPNSGSRASAVLRLKLLGANPAAKVSGEEELPGKANYFIGNDPGKWRTNVPTYAKVNYKDVYPGVDLLYYGNQSGQLEYDFVVAPGADASAIALDVAAGLSRHLSGKNGGVKPPLQIAADGDLVIPTEGGELRFHKPVAYQEQDSGVRIQGQRTHNKAQRTIANHQSQIPNPLKLASCSPPRTKFVLPLVPTTTARPWSSTPCWFIPPTWAGALMTWPTALPWIPPGTLT